MAETVVIAPLTREMIEQGTEFVRALEQDGVTILADFWFLKAKAGRLAAVHRNAGYQQDRLAGIVWESRLYPGQACAGAGLRDVRRWDSFAHTFDFQDYLRTGDNRI